MDVFTTPQTFFEAGGKDVFPDLKMVGTISVITSHSKECRVGDMIDKGIELLIKKCEKEGYDAVFQLRWEEVYKMHEAYGPDYILHGTAYKRRKENEL